MDEVLVLLEASGTLTSGALAEAEPVASAAPQLFGERVVICHLTAGQRERVARMAGVAGVYGGRVPEEVELPGDMAGRLAVGAWNERRRTEAEGAKRRIGEGAAWDDPRFEREGRPTTAED